MYRASGIPVRMPIPNESRAKKALDTAIGRVRHRLRVAVAPMPREALQLRSEDELE